MSITQHFEIVDMNRQGYQGYAPKRMGDNNFLQRLQGYAPLGNS